MGTDAIEKTLTLVSSALGDVDNPDVPLSAVVRKAIRIARLRNDYDNLWWLSNEMISYQDSSSRRRAMREIELHYSRKRHAEVRDKILNAYRDERKYVSQGQEKSDDEELMCIFSVTEIEQHLRVLGADLAGSAYAPAEMMDFRNVLARIGHRVHEFLSITEKQLVSGQFASDIFERNRRYVDLQLQVVSPEAMEQLHAACRCVEEGDSESRSHALLSCRRALKSIADRLYPPRVDLVAGTDGKERDLSEEKYVNRLWQYVADRVKGHASGDLLLSQVTDLGNRVEAIYGLSNKGTHAEVSESEANQCVIQTYLIVGDILLLAEGESAIGSETEEEDSNAGSIAT